jgi:Bacterial Ig domain
VPASMPLLFGAGLWGVITTFLPRRPVMVRSLRIFLLVAAASGAALMLYGTILERFVADMMPLLVLASMIGMVDIWRRLDGRRRARRILVPAVIGILALIGFVASMGIAITPQDNWTQTQTDHYVQAEQAVSNVTGHPLSGYLVRANSFPSRAPIGQLFIEGRCGALYVADQAVPNGLLLSDPWLLVERAPHTPLCDSLIAMAKNVSLGTSIVSPPDNETVSGSDVVVRASTSGVGKISTVSFELIGSSAFAVTILGAGTHGHAGWTYVWDSRATPNGTYSLRSVVKNTAGYAASSPGVTVTVHNPAKGL